MADDPAGRRRGAPCAAVHPRQRGRQALGDAVAEVMHVPFHVSL